MPITTRRMRDVRPSQRSGPSGAWLAFGLTLILLGYPLGLLFAALGLPIDAWAIAYVVAAIVASAAAALFFRWRTRGARGDEAKILSRRD